MDAVLIAIIVLIGVVLTVMAVGFIATRFSLARSLKRGRQTLPPAAPSDVEVPALSVTAPFKGTGILRLTEHDMVFGNGSTREALRIPRRDIVSCTATSDLPGGKGGQALRWPVLVLQIDDPALPQGLAFVVKDPKAWVQRLRG